MKLAVINKSEIMKSGIWSAKFHVERVLGNNPYQVIGGALVACDSKGSLPVNAIYLSDTAAIELRAALKSVSDAEVVLRKAMPDYSIRILTR